MFTNDILHILLAVSWYLCLNGKMCFPFFTVWYTKCLCGISSLELAVCSPALIHFKPWAQSQGNRRVSFPFVLGSHLCVLQCSVMQNLVLIPGNTTVQLRLIDPVSEEGNEKWFQCAVQSCLSKSCVQRVFFMAGDTEPDGCVAVCFCKWESMYFSHLMCLLTL